MKKARRPRPLCPAAAEESGMKLRRADREKLKATKHTGPFEAEVRRMSL